MSKSTTTRSAQRDRQLTVSSLAKDIVGKDFVSNDRKLAKGDAEPFCKIVDIPMGCQHRCSWKAAFVTFALGCTGAVIATIVGKCSPHPARCWWWNLTPCIPSTSTATPRPLHRP
jgi:hypothetical protein